MLPTLYDALGLRQDASAPRIRAALRGQIRKYCAQTRDNQGTVEDALRLIDRTSRILTDPELRAQYDGDIAAARRAVAERVGRDRSDDTDDEPPTLATLPLTVTVESGPGSGEGAARRGGLTEKVSAIRGPSPAVIAASASFLLLVAVTAIWLTPVDPLSHVPAMGFALLAAVGFIGATYYVVRLAYRWWRPRDPKRSASTIDLGAVGWRHRNSLFLGDVEVRKDSGWLFNLRTAELDRARLGRITTACPWRRLAARLLDYGLWGLVLWLVLAALAAAGFAPGVAADALGQPLLAAVVITASWIPAEALALAFVRTTFGKWLFGVHVQFAISDPYARRVRSADVLRAAARALRVWVQGVACGFLVLAPASIALARERLEAIGETAWDGAEDCLVSHSPLTGIGAATGSAGLLVFVWLYAVMWSPVLDGALASARVQLAKVIPGTAVAPRSAAEAARLSGEAAAVNAEMEAQFAQRRERIAVLSTNGLRQLDARNYLKAAELCGEWADLERGNVKAWQCLGRSLNALGQYRDAAAALRRAKQLAPQDTSIDGDLARSERGVVEDFRSRGVR